MRIIILAAGMGTRLRPLTNNKPKCMVKFENKPLIEHQLSLFKSFELEDINVVAGYLSQMIHYPNIRKFYNPKYFCTNMVNTLFCAEELFDGEDDILISYGDIIYNKNVLESILASTNKINVVIDKGWKKYWSKRMDYPLNDAETLKINTDGFIKEIGKKAYSYDDIEGQYIGLIKIRKDVVKNMKDFYNSLDKTKIYDGKDFNNMYMTSFLQLVADRLENLSPIYINNGWIEIDEPSDLNYGEFLHANKF